MKIILFTSHKSSICGVQKANMREITSKYEMDLKYIDIDNTFNKKMVERYKIDTVPTLIIYSPEFSLRYNGFTNTKSVLKDIKDKMKAVKMV
jgi:hypothetical protein